MCGDGGPAALAGVDARRLTLGGDGSIFFADQAVYHARVRRIGPDGIVTTVAGGGLRYEEGIPATEADLFPDAIAVAPDGNLYVAEPRAVGSTTGSSFGPRVRRIDPNGIIRTAAGGIDAPASHAAGNPATSVAIGWPRALVSGPNRSLYIGSDGGWDQGALVYGVGPVFAGYTSQDILIPAADGSQAYLFAPDGRHLRTLMALTGATLYTFGYDGSGRLTRIEDGSGNVTAIERDGQGRPTAIVAPHGQRTGLALDAGGYLAAVTNPAGETTRFTYAPGGLLTSFAPPGGGARQFSYGALGRLVADQGPGGSSFALSRAVATGSTTVTVRTALDRSTSYALAALPDGTEQRVNQFPDGARIQSWRGANGSTLTALANGASRVSVQGPDPRFAMQAPLAQSTVITTPGGRALTVTLTRTVALEDPLELFTLAVQTDTMGVNGRLFTTRYQAATRTFVDTTPTGRQSTTTIDSLGRITREQIGGLFPLRYTFDARGRLATVSQGSGSELRTVSLGYDAGGWLAAITDALGRVGRFTYDSAGRVTVQTLPDTRQIRYGYDVDGNVTSITPPGRPAHRFTYTPDGLVATNSPPAVGGVSSQLQYTYNRDRQLSRIARPDGKRVDFGYDAGGRLSTVTLGRGQVRYAYAAGGGLLAGITAPDGGTLAFTYDGPLLTGQRWTGSVAGVVRYGYDADLRLNALTIGGGSAFALAYDADGLLTQAGELRLTHGVQHGLLTATTLGKVSTAWRYNGFGELVGASATCNGASLLAVEYSRDKLGRITGMTETVGGLTTVSGYSYDLAGRLVQVRQNSVVAAAYTFDSNGNRLSATGPGGTLQGVYDDQDRLHQYGGATYGYTANGELLTKTSGGQTTSYSYDELGNLMGVSLPNGKQITYLVDGQNRRIGKRVDGALVQGFLYLDQLEPVAELDGAGNVVSRFLYASRAQVPDYMVKGGVTYRIVSDHLGSPRLVVNVTTGAIAQAIQYDAFGAIVADSQPGFQPFGFGGGLYDRDTALVRLGARDYDARTGRWTLREPLAFAGGQTNQYVYANGDPVNLLDVDGLQAAGASPALPGEKPYGWQARVSNWFSRLKTLWDLWQLKRALDDVRQHPLSDPKALAGLEALFSQACGFHPASPYCEKAAELLKQGLQNCDLRRVRLENEIRSWKREGVPGFDIDSWRHQ